MGCFSGRLMSAASDQKLFCELCSAFNCSFDEFVGEKVVSPSYSSTILAPPLLLRLLKEQFKVHSKVEEGAESSRIPLPPQVQSLPLLLEGHICYS